MNPDHISFEEATAAARFGDPAIIAAWLDQSQHPESEPCAKLLGGALTHGQLQLIPLLLPFIAPGPATDKVLDVATTMGAVDVMVHLWPLCPSPAVRQSAWNIALNIGFLDLAMRFIDDVILDAESGKHAVCMAASSGQERIVDMLASRVPLYPAATHLLDRLSIPDLPSRYRDDFIQGLDMLSSRLSQAEQDVVFRQAQTQGIHVPSLFARQERCVLDEVVAADTVSAARPRV